MNTTISIDKEIRNRAAKRAKQEKLSISAIVRILLTDYAEGKIQIGARFPQLIQMSSIEVDEETQNLMDNTIRLWRKKNI